MGIANQRLGHYSYRSASTGFASAASTAYCLCAFSLDMPFQDFFTRSATRRLDLSSRLELPAN
jgi:hypothetical protein